MFPRNEIQKYLEIYKNISFLVVANTCGSTVNQNNSYIQSPNYPAASSTGMCMFNIEKCDSNICQYKYVNYISVSKILFRIV